MFILIVWRASGDPIAHSIHDSYDDAVYRGIALGVRFGVQKREG